MPSRMEMEQQGLDVDREFRWAQLSRSAFANFYRRYEIGDRAVEEETAVLSPDLATAYAQLAPCVSEAFVFLHVGDVASAKRALEKAQAVITSVTSPLLAITFKKPDQEG